MKGENSVIPKLVSLSLWIDFALTVGQLLYEYVSYAAEIVKIACRGVTRLKWQEEY